MPVGFWADPDGSRYRAAYFEQFPGVWTHGDWITMGADGTCAVGLGAARLIISFGVAVGVSFALGLSGVAQGVLVLQGAMPAAVFSYLFAAQYERDADDIAGIVLVSTLLGAVTLPLLVSYALWLAR